jgi:hypothetical protein
MARTTLADPEVGSFLAAHYAAIRFDLSRPHPDFAEATRTAKVVWAPTVIVDDPRGRELRRFTGWLPTAEWIAEMRLPLALDHVHHRRFAEAAAELAWIAEGVPEAPAAPEALHWLGIVEFLAGGRDAAALHARWSAVRARYPGSRFARHSEVIDDAP